MADDVIATTYIYDAQGTLLLTIQAHVAHPILGTMVAGLISHPIVAKAEVFDAAGCLHRRYLEQPNGDIAIAGDN